MRHTSRLLAASLGLAALAGCGSDPADTDGAADEPTQVVAIASSRFEPRELTVAAGSAVTFENTDPFAHTVTADPEAQADFDSGDLTQDATFEVRFDEAGTYAYFCRIHPTMRAEVIVQ